MMKRESGRGCRGELRDTSLGCDSYVGRIDGEVDNDAAVGVSETVIAGTEAQGREGARARGRGRWGPRLTRGE